MALQADLFYLFILIFFKLNAERKIQSYEKADSTQIQLPDESDSLWQLRSMLQEMKTDEMSSHVSFSKQMQRFCPSLCEVCGYGHSFNKGPYADSPQDYQPQRGCRY